MNNSTDVFFSPIPYADSLPSFQKADTSVHHLDRSSRDDSADVPVPHVAAAEVAGVGVRVCSMPECKEEATHIINLRRKVDGQQASAKMCFTHSLGVSADNALLIESAGGEWEVVGRTEPDVARAPHHPPTPSTGVPVSIHLPLHKLVERILRHKATEHVLPKWLLYTTHRDGFWWVSGSGDISDDAARLIVEACLWRRLWNSAVHPMNFSPGVWMVMDHEQNEYINFGDDLAFALAFACGVPMPERT